MVDLKILEELSNAFGPSGFEEDVVRVVKKYCGGLAVRKDSMHNVYAEMTPSPLTAVRDVYKRQMLSLEDAVIAEPEQSYGMRKQV